jgi:sulfur-oxidizing protein SoxX
MVAALVGDPVRGREIATSRSTGLCVLCHALPGVPAVQAGTIGPPLAGVGARYTRAQLRERLVAPERFNPQTVMPSATRRDGFERVAAARADQPLLDAQQLEDLLAWLETLK